MLKEHSCYLGALIVKFDRLTDRETARQTTDKMIPMCRFVIGDTKMNVYKDIKTNTYTKFQVNETTDNDN